MLHPGLYEKLINTETASTLSSIPEERKATAPVDAAEAPVVLSEYVAEAVRKSLQDMGSTSLMRRMDCPTSVHWMYTAPIPAISCCARWASMRSAPCVRA